MKLNHIVFNYQKESTFINKDKYFISLYYPLIIIKYNSNNKIFTPLLFIYQLFTLIVSWRKYSIVVSEIASYHTFIPSILSFLKLKKHIIILHGTDSNIIPEINYGNLQKPILKWFTSFSIKNATLLLPVSESLIESENTFCTYKKARFGLKNIIPNLKTDYQIVYNCLDATYFKITNFQRNPNTLLTVAVDLDKEKNFKLKGIDFILKLAQSFPQYQFSILGSEKIFGYDNSLENVNVIGEKKQSELERYYNNHSFYLQLSNSESFGLSLCEAMLCGCIPIVSNVGMMTKIVDNDELVLKNQDTKQFLLIMENCKKLANSKCDMESRRNTVIKRFSDGIRKNQLIHIINELN